MILHYVSDRALLAAQRWLGGLPAPFDRMLMAVRVEVANETWRRQILETLIFDWRLDWRHA